MILAIDMGNTNIVIGCVDDKKVLFEERLSTDYSKTELEYAIGFKTVLEIYNINSDDIKGAIISSVVPQLVNIIKAAVEKTVGITPLMVGPGIKTGLNILMPERFGIPFYLFPITKENKMEQEKAEMELLEQHNINFIVLARYMQVISEQMIEAYPNRIINIHHSFLPAFVGAKPYHAAFERGVKIIGATSHYVTSELDAGPIIEQDVVRITHKDTVQDLVSKGKDLEKIVLSRAVQKHIERKVLAYKNKTVIFS